MAFKPKVNKHKALLTGTDPLFDPVLPIPLSHPHSTLSCFDEIAEYAGNFMELRISNPYSSVGPNVHVSILPSPVDGCRQGWLKASRDAVWTGGEMVLGSGSPWTDAGGS